MRKSRWNPDDSPLLPTPPPVAPGTGGPPKKKPRKASEFARIYGSKKRVAWVQSLQCIACEWSGQPQLCASQNAHTVSGGKGRKADYDTIVPMCHSHHRAYDEYRGVFAVPDVRDAIKKEAGRVEDEWQLHPGSITER